MEINAHIFKQCDSLTPAHHGVISICTVRICRQQQVRFDQCACSNRRRCDTYAKLRLYS
jgi:hypothetical protein